MRLLLILLASTLLMGGCTRHHRPLELSKKERLVSELIDPAPRCEEFKNRLTSDTMDDDGVDDVYHAALKAHCIKKDV